MLNLYPHQSECVQALLKSWMGNQFTLFVGPTGLGKTEILIGLTEFVFEHRPEATILFLVNRKDLLKQTANRFEKVFPNFVGRWFGGEKFTRPITISTVQSMKSCPLVPDIVFLDEAHNIDQEKGVYKNAIDLMIKRNPSVRFVACTATPYREGDGEIFGSDKWFKSVAFKCDLSWAIDNGHLCDYVLGRGKENFDTSKLRVRRGEFIAKDLAKLAEDRDKVGKQVRDALERLQGRKCALWATTCINHATDVALALTHLGETAVAYHSQIQDRDCQMQKFKAGDYRHIVNVAMLNEGFDHPAIDAVVVMRPTRSTRLYVQMVGRGLRKFEGKQDCLILDYGNVVVALGDVRNPVIPKKRGKGEAPMKDCPECGLYIPLGQMKCSCGHEFQCTVRDMLAGLSENCYEPGMHNFTATMVTVREYRSRAGNLCVKFEMSSPDLLEAAKASCFSKYFVIETASGSIRMRNRQHCSTFHKRLLGEELEYPVSGPKIFLGEFPLSVCRNGKYWDVALVDSSSNP